jgi:hypothetical protein
LTILYRGKVEKGQFIPDSKFQWNSAFMAFNNQRVTVSIKKVSKPRSLNQNAYYWGVVLKIFGEHLGYTLEEIHEVCKWQFLKVFRDNLPTTVKSTDRKSVV